MGAVREELQVKETLPVPVLILPFSNHFHQSMKSRILTPNIHIRKQLQIGPRNLHKPLQNVGKPGFTLSLQSLTRQLTLAQLPFLSILLLSNLDSPFPCALSPHHPFLSPAAFLAVASFGCRSGSVAESILELVY